MFAGAVVSIQAAIDNSIGRFRGGVSDEVEEELKEEGAEGGREGRCRQGVRSVRLQCLGVGVGHAAGDGAIVWEDEVTRASFPCGVNNETTRRRCIAGGQMADEDQPRGLQTETDHLRSLEHLDVPLPESVSLRDVVGE